MHGPPPLTSPFLLALHCSVLHLIPLDPIAMHSRPCNRCRDVDGSENHGHPERGTVGMQR
uniref:Uncharacterized protein n=1 Tax=Physcomitrium patens TaxID=3218 RepID=A0A2K1ISU6_PHYPA|nr:hypothetical protein PHYPA_026471 [Physcomitrium patens]